jgi:hypothetical protein
MKNGMPEHFWRIHNRVAKRILSDAPDRVRTIIAQDSEHETEEYKWFDAKVNEDAKRLFEDPSYYDNTDFSFRVPKTM